MVEEHSDNLSVVLIDDRPERRRLMRQILLGQGSTDITEVEDWTAAAAHIEDHRTDVAVLEIQLPIEAGLVAVAALRNCSPTLPIVVCSFHVDAATKQRAFDGGADSYLEKPVRGEDLRKAIDAASTKRGRGSDPSTAVTGRPSGPGQSGTDTGADAGLDGSAVPAGSPLV
jgi:CheY-like chemotaxis protein